MSTLERRPGSSSRLAPKHNPNDQTHVGLLIARVGIGIMFMIHGWPKIVGGPETWTRLGGAMANLGIEFAPALWGLMAAVSEFGGGLLLAAGLLHRVAAPALAFTMFVAMLMHLLNGDPFIPKVSYPLELMILFLALTFTGPGRFSLDARLFSPRTPPLSNA